MTESTRDRDGVPGNQPGHSALSRLIAVEPNEFARDYWGRHALLSPSDRLPSPYTDLLDADAYAEQVAGWLVGADLAGHVGDEGAVFYGSERDVGEAFGARHHLVAQVVELRLELGGARRVASRWWETR